MSPSTDRIEKQILLRVPLELVWSAISNAREFGSWFGAQFDGPFVAGEQTTGKIVPTTVDEEVAKSQKPYEGQPFEITVERIEPMEHFSFRWHPYAVDPDVDYLKEPTTLVVFELEKITEGTLLTITESGYDSLPLDRRAKAFEMNEQGWEAQLTLIKKYSEKRPNG